MILFLSSKSFIDLDFDLDEIHSARVPEFDFAPFFSPTLTTATYSE